MRLRGEPRGSRPFRAIVDPETGRFNGAAGQPRGSRVLIGAVSLSDPRKHRFRVA